MRRHAAPEETVNARITRAVTSVERAGVAYCLHAYVHEATHTVYGQEAADTLQLDRSRVCKTLIADSRGPDPADRCHTGGTDTPNRLTDGNLQDQAHVEHGPCDDNRQLVGTALRLLSTRRSPVLSVLDEPGLAQQW